MALITGTAKSASGTALTSGTIVFTPVLGTVYAEDVDTIFPNPISATIGAAGAMSFTLLEGVYNGAYSVANGPNVSFKFMVPAGATADFNDCLTSA